MNYEKKQIVKQYSKMIDIIRCYPDIDRSTLAKYLGISLPTLSNCISELKNENILLTKSTDSIEINKDSLVVNPYLGMYIGISIGASQIKVTFVNFDYSVFSQDEFKKLKKVSGIFTDEIYLNKDENILGYACVRTPNKYDDLVDVIDNVMQNCIKLNSYLLENNTSILGIGFAITGAIDNKSKRIIKAYNLDCLKDLTTSYDTLIFGNRIQYLNENNIDLAFENIARAAIVSEKYSLYDKKNINYRHRNKKNIACIYLGSGIGSGLVLNNRLYRGTSNFSELGHVDVCDPDFAEGPFQMHDETCTCGSKNCLEYKIRNNALGISLETFKKMSATDLMTAVCTAPDKEDKMKLLGHYIGTTTNGLINILNLDLVIFTGKLTVLMDDLWKYLNQTIVSNKINYTTTDCSVIVSSYGSLAPSIGAAISSANYEDGCISWE